MGVGLDLACEAERGGDRIELRGGAAPARSSVNTIADARRPSSARKPAASLSVASATTATQGRPSPARARSASTAAILNGTCAPSNTTGSRDDPTEMSSRSMRPMSRAAARVSASSSPAPISAPERPRTPFPPSSSRTAPASATLVSSIVASSAGRWRARRGSRSRRPSPARRARLLRRDRAW